MMVDNPLHAMTTEYANPAAHTRAPEHANDLNSENAELEKTRDSMRNELIAQVHTSGLESGTSADLINEIQRSLGGNTLPSKAALSTLSGNIQARINQVVLAEKIKEDEKFLQQEIVAEAAYYEQNQQYGQLSAPSRHRIDILSKLMMKKEWTEEEKVTVVQQTAVSGDIAETPFGKKIAQEVNKMPGTDHVLEEIKHTDPKAVRAAQIESEHAQEATKKIIDTMQEPQKAAVKEIAFLAPHDDKTVAVIKDIQKHPEKAEDVRKQAEHTFIAHAGKYYHDALSALPADEQRALAKMGGLEGAVGHARDMYKNDGARFKQALYYNNEKALQFTKYTNHKAVDSFSEEAKTDGAALHALELVVTRMTLEDLATRARELEHAHGKSSAIDLDAAKLFDKNTSMQERETILAKSLQKQYPSVPEDQRHVMAHNILDTVAHKYGSAHLDKIATASNETLNKMSRHAAMDTAQDVLSNIMSFDDKVTDKVSLTAGRGVRRTLESLHIGSGTAQEVGHLVTETMKLGAQVKKTFLHDSHLDSALKGAGDMWNHLVGNEPEKKAVAHHYDAADAKTDIQKNLSAFSKIQVTDAHGHKSNPFNLNHDSMVGMGEVTNALKKAHVNLADFAGKDGVLSQEELQKAIAQASKNLTHAAASEAHSAEHPAAAQQTPHAKPKAATAVSH